MALDLTSIVGFRKVIVCLVGIIAISTICDGEHHNHCRTLLWNQHS